MSQKFKGGYGIRSRFLAAYSRGKAHAIVQGTKAWNVLSEFASAEKARELADTNEAPEVTFRRMGRLIIRAIPYMKPMLLHIVIMFSIGFALTFLYTFTGSVAHDMWQNKLMVGEKLQPLQANLILVDESYVRPDMLDGAEERADGEDVEVEKMTVDQRRVVRNRMYFWYALGGIFGILTGATLPYYGLWIWQNVNHSLRVAMLDRLEYLSLSFHHSNRAGDAIYRIYQDSSMIVNVLDEALIGPTERLRGLLIALAFVTMFDPLLLGVIVLVWIPMFVLTVWYTPRIRKRSVANRVANSHLTSRVQETFNAFKVVKATRSENTMLNRFRKDSKTALDAAFHLRFDMVMLSLVVMMIGGFSVIITEYLMVTWVLDKRPTFLPAWAAAFISFTVWNLAAFESARGRYGESVGTGYGLVRLWCMLQDLFIGLERAFYFLDLKPGVEEPEHPRKYPDKVAAVKWDNVHFAYPDGPEVLHGVDLIARAGTVTAIVGSTGSGKSTLMSLLLRLYDPQQGNVYVDDINVREFGLEDIRAHISIAMQKNVLFTGNVAENISYAVTDASPDDIAIAAKVACVDEFIHELENGYQTDIGQRGSKLSSGQRQRITIARSIIRDTPILVLDEPTASLDVRTEQRVLRNIAEWASDRVVLVVTHRLSTIRNADNIAYLGDGRIAEFGSHEELMQIEDGRYRAFVDANLGVSNAVDVSGS